LNIYYNIVYYKIFYLNIIRKDNKGYDFETHFISDKRFRLPKIYKPFIKEKILSNSETLFPNLYKKKKVVYDDFSKIYLTNIRKIKDSDSKEYNNTKESLDSPANNPIINSNLNSTAHKLQANGIIKETIKNSFMYSFRDKFKKQQTLYNIKQKNKSQISTSINTGTTYNVNDINIENTDKMIIMTNYVSII